MKLKERLTLAIACAAALVPAAALAQTRDTAYLVYGFYGPANHKYLIELFEPGAPYPSRQDWTLYDSKYNGQYTYTASWSYIARSTYYFIRVTDKTTGQAKQSSAFKIRDVDSYQFGTFNWLKM